VIELSKNSWHYRFSTWYTDRYHRSLCPYVRAVLFGGLIFTAVATAVTWIGFGALLILACLITGGSYFNLPPWVQMPGIITAVCLIAAAVVWLVVQYKEWRDRKNHIEWEREYQRKYGDNSEEYVPPQPSLFRLYWRAIHDKLCPMIEFKSEPDPDPEWPRE
jgi:hypothetical protein